MYYVDHNDIFVYHVDHNDILYRGGIVSIVAQSPSHRGEIAQLFIRDAATLQLLYARSCYALNALATPSLRPTRFRGCAI